MINLKSLFAESKPSDGTRILIIKYAQSFYDFDEHMPLFSPTTELTNLYESHKISWDEYSAKFIIEMEPRWPQISILRRRCDKGSTITLLSFEYDSQRSHSCILKDLIAECNFWTKTSENQGKIDEKI